MNRVLEVIIRTRAEQPTWLKTLATIFDAMDAGYDQAAGHYGFVCRGCEDSCCRTRFYHHTLLEYMYVHKGFERLTGEERQNAVARAAVYSRQHGEADAAGTGVKVMCPLNVEGFCTVYDVRPMICRLHGIPHELHQPGRGVLHGPGCEQFTAHSADRSDGRFDRTPFYEAMAGLEKEFRAALGVHVKFKQTIAEMITSFPLDCLEKNQGENL